MTMRDDDDDDDDSSVLIFSFCRSDNRLLLDTFRLEMEVLVRTVRLAPVRLDHHHHFLESRMLVNGVPEDSVAREEVAVQSARGSRPRSDATENNC